jgi:hypothetical protein
MKIKKFEVDEKVTEYFTLLLKVCMANPEVIDYKQSSLSPSCSATLNLLDFNMPEKFYNYTGRLLRKSEEATGEILRYHYMHMVDYTNGGIMSVHSHKHNEDYSFILYLNDCSDGHTVLHLKNQYRVTPKKGTVLLFSSLIPHSSEYSKSKQVFVGGLKIKHEV